MTPLYSTAVILAFLCGVDSAVLNSVTNDDIQYTRKYNVNVINSQFKSSFKVNVANF